MSVGGQAIMDPQKGHGASSVASHPRLTSESTGYAGDNARDRGSQNKTEGVSFKL